jgi:prefoldin subunit 5
MKAVTSYFAKDDAPGPDHAATTQDSDSITSQDTINLYPDQGKTKTGIPTTKNVDGDNENTLSKGGNKEMADETTNEVEEATPVEIVEEFAETPEAVDGDSVEKAATVSEVPVDELDFVKMVDTLKTDVTTSIEKNYADHAATASDMYAAVDAIKKSIDDFGGKHSDLTNNVADVVKRLESLEKRIDAYENDTAVQKSGAVENTVTDENKITKSIWQGHFLGAQSL